MAYVNPNRSHGSLVAKAKADCVGIVSPKVVEADPLVDIPAIIESSEPKILVHQRQVCRDRDAEF